jgi:short chain dehydrogenase
MNPAATVIDKLVNPRRVSDIDRLRDSVSGATVLVTGASFGIGEASAYNLAAAGATVLMAAVGGQARRHRAGHPHQWRTSDQLSGRPE